MKSTDRAHVLLERVAQNNGVSYKEVKSEIEAAIRIAMANSSGNAYAQRFWKAVPCAGEIPTAEELLAYMAENRIGSCEK